MARTVKAFSKAFCTATVGLMGIAVLGACSSSSTSAPSTPSTNPTATHSTSATAVPGPPCDKTAIAKAVPSGSTIVGNFKCANGYASAALAPEAWPIMKAEGNMWVLTKDTCSSPGSVPAATVAKICG